MHPHPEPYSYAEIAEWLKLDEPEDKPAPQPKPRITDTNGRKVPGSYFDKALDRVCAEIAATPEGNRDNATNQGAFAIGQLDHYFPYRGQEARQRLVEAAMDSGLHQAEAARAVNSGIEAGKKKPRDIQDNGHAPRPEPTPPEDIQSFYNPLDTPDEDDFSWEKNRPDPEPTTPTETPELQEPHATEPTETDPWSFLEIEPYFDTDPPPLQWILEGQIPRGIVGQLAAAGGTGKTFLLITLSVGMAQGLRMFKSFIPPKPLRILAFFSEDPPDETLRRFRAVVKDMDLSAKDRKLITQNFMIVANKSEPLVILQDGNAIPSPAYSRLREMIQLHKPDIVYLDTQSRFCGVEENLNHLAARFIALLQDLATEGNCTILLTHHVNKQDGKTRGATAFKDGCRWGAEMRELSEGDAKLFKLNPQHCYRFVEFECTKLNQGRKPPPIVFERIEGGVLYERTDLYRTEISRDPDFIKHVATAIAAELRNEPNPMAETNILKDKNGVRTRVYERMKPDRISRDIISQAIQFGTENGILRASQTIHNGNKEPFKVYSAPNQSDKLC
jgi:hypothetical protein